MLGGVKIDFKSVKIEKITDDQREQLTKRVFKHTEQAEFTAYVDALLKNKDVVGNELNVKVSIDEPYNKVKNLAYVYVKNHKNNEFVPLVKADKSNTDKCYLIFKENIE